MSVAPGTTFPNFRGRAIDGNFDLYKYLGSSWGVVVSHPNIFTPVCTSEIAQLTQLQSEFSKRNVKLVVVSINKVEHKQAWARDIGSVAGEEVKFAMVADESGEICKRIGITNKFAVKKAVRSVCIIAPDKQVLSLLLYPDMVGRNFTELLGIIDCLLLAWSRSDVAVPAGWKPGKELLLRLGQDTSRCSKMYKLPSGKKYLNYVKE